MSYNLVGWRLLQDVLSATEMGPWALSQYKDSLSWYGDFHCKDKTVSRLIFFEMAPWFLLEGGLQQYENKLTF